MTKQEKYQFVEELSERMKNTDNFYIMDAAGLTVAEVNAFRGMCFKKGLSYQVVKNSLIWKALETLEGGDFSEFKEKGVLKGFSGIVFSPDSANEPAKVLKEYRKKHGKKDDPKILLKGASISLDVFVGDEQLEALSAIKSKNELIGDVVGLLQSPAKNVLGALQSGGQTIAGIIKTLSEREEA